MEEMKEKISIEVDKDYFDKMNPEDSTAITVMCMEKLSAKAQELKDLYVQLVKTYSIEIGLCDITLLVQVSSTKLPFIPVQGILGTEDGIKDALDKLMSKGLENLADIKKEEESNDQKQS